MYVCMYVSVNACTYLCVYVCMYVYIHKYLYVYMYIRTYVYMCMYVYSLGIQARPIYPSYTVASERPTICAAACALRCVYICDGARTLIQARC